MLNSFSLKTSPEYAQVVAGWTQSFSRDAAVESVDFRKLAPSISQRDRHTHLIHPYPAKLIPEIPHFFLRSGLAPVQNRRVRLADPFCGSGTVLLEGLLAGCDVMGADSNPLARLISRVKTHPLEEHRIARSLSTLARIYNGMSESEPPLVVNLHYWYSKRIIHGLSRLRASIKQLRDERIREFMQLCLSATAKKLSYADPRLSVPVKIAVSRKENYGAHYPQLKKHLEFLRRADVLAVFSEIAAKNAGRLSELSAVLARSCSAEIYSNAIRLEDDIVNGPIDLIITSPPYLGAQKYIRSSSLSLGWLDLAEPRDLRRLEAKNLGREHYHRNELGTAAKSGIVEADCLIEEVQSENPLRAHIAWTYLNEMRQALQSMYAVLAPGGHAIIVVGPNTICGRAFNTPAYVQALAISVGFITKFKLVDHIKSRGLMTKRNKTAGIITNEVVLCLRRPQ